MKNGLILVGSFSFMLVATTSIALANECTIKYQRPSAKLSEFIANKFILHNKSDIRAIIKNNRLVEGRCMLDRGRMIKHGGLFCIEGTVGSGGYATRNGINRVLTLSGGDGSADHTIILDGIYYASDVKRSIEKSMPGLVDNYDSDHGFATNESSKYYVLNSNYLSVDSWVAGYEGENREKLQNTLVNITVNLENNKVQKCLRKKAASESRRKKLRNKGSNLSLE